MIFFAFFIYFFNILEVILKNYFEINDDVYFISQRIKELDRSYHILYNLTRHCYEVHSFEQSDGYCFTVPFQELDERTLQFAHKTRRENQDKIIKEIEKNNEDLYKKQLKEQVKMLKEAIYVSERHYNPGL